MDDFSSSSSIAGRPRFAPRRRADFKPGRAWTLVARLQQQARQAPRVGSTRVKLPQDARNPERIHRNKQANNQSKLAFQTGNWI
jgi:hypothetical protein